VEAGHRRGALAVLIVLAILLPAACADAPATTPAPGPAPSSVPPGPAPPGDTTPPTVAAEPVALARQITAAQDIVADPARSPEEVAAAGRVFQVAVEELAFHPDRLAPVLAALPPRWADVTNRVVGAGRDLLSMAKGAPGDELPAWRIVDPLPPAQLRAYYAEAQDRFGVSWSVLAAVNLVESRMGRIASNSDAGARGPMQFMPSTWASYGLGGDIANPHDAILGAANYLRANGAAGGTDAAVDRALYRYNNDDRYVAAVRAYAGLMQADERAYLGFHAWVVYFRTTSGRVLLPTGYDEPQAIRAVDYLARTGAPGR
jgi:soluble lytic murein transglycosylase-like protein